MLVHALKSTSRMIGAAELSDIAARMEKAANEGNGEIIGRDHDSMIAQYERVAAAIFSICEPNGETIAGEGKTSEDKGLAEDDGIMEFFPE